MTTLYVHIEMAAIACKVVCNRWPYMQNLSATWLPVACKLNPGGRHTHAKSENKGKLLCLWQRPLRSKCLNLKIETELIFKILWNVIACHSASFNTFEWFFI